MNQQLAHFQRFMRLYRESRELKLLLNGAEAAIERLHEAERIAEAEDLEPSLAGLVQYRLGHLYLRRARGVDDLEEAEQCFFAAARLPVLKAWAAPYRLACLARLHSLTGDPRLLARIEDVWVHAANLVNRAAAGEIDGGNREPIPLQHATFNLLELATYFLGRNHDELLGRSGRTAAEATGETAIVVGTGLSGRRDVLPFAVAERVVERFSAGVEGAFVFTLPPGIATSRARSREGTWTAFGPSSARLLAFLLLGEAHSTRQLDHRLAGGEADGPATGNRRQTMKRTRDRLAVLTGLASATLLVDRAPDVPTLPQGLPIFGAVDLARLDHGDV